MSREIERALEKQSDIAYMWDEMIPPPNGQIIINRLGTVCMSYETLQQLGYECNDKSEIFAEWKKEWEKK